MKSPKPAECSNQRKESFVKGRIALFAYLLLFFAFTLSAGAADGYFVSGIVHDTTGALIDRL